MDNQTNQEKAEQIEKDIVRLGLQTAQQKSIFRSLAMSLPTYHQCTGTVLARGINKTWDKSLRALWTTCEKYERLLNSMEGLDVLDALAKASWEVKLKLYPKIYKKLNEILLESKKNQGEVNQTTLETAIVNNTINGNTNSIFNCKSEKVKKTLEEVLMRGLSKSNSAEALLKYYMNDGIPKIIKKLEAEIVDGVNNCCL